MKRFIALIICITTLATMLLGSWINSYAAFNKATALKIANESLIYSLKAKAYAVGHMDKEGGLVRESKTSHEHYSIGNLVKLMTLYLTFEAVSEGKTTLKSGIKVSSAAQKISVNHERVFLDAGKGEIISVEDALIAICVQGANDAGYALAEKLSGSDEAGFVVMMNNKAKELGMNDTHYVDSTGLKTIEDGQYSCAADLLTLSYNLIKNYPDVLNYTCQDSQMFKHTSTSQPDTQMYSSNMIISLNMLSGCDGLLVGYSNADKYALASTYMVDGERVLAVVIGEETNELRCGESIFLLKYATQTFNKKQIAEEGTYVRKLSVTDGKETKVKTCIGSDLYYLADTSIDGEIQNTIVIDGEIKAPISKGDIVGSVNYKLVYEIKDKDGNVTEVTEDIGSVDLVCAEDMDRANWFIRLIRKILKFFGIGD